MSKYLKCVLDEISIMQRLQNEYKIAYILCLARMYFIQL